LSHRRHSPARTLLIERLSARELLAGDALPSYHPLDVNDDLRVSALDALVVINHLSPLDPANSTMEALDVDRNGKVTALDALRVINALERGPISVMRLVNDTAPRGTTNRDGVTSDLTLEGRINWPESIPPSHREVFLTAKPSDGDPRYQSLGFLASGHFQIASGDIDEAVRRAIHSDTRVLNLELRYGVGTPDWSADPIAAISVRFDNQRPSITLPTWISPTAKSASILLSDHLPIFVGTPQLPLGSTPIFRLENEIVPVEWQHGADYDVLDLAIGDVAGGEQNVLVISTDGAIEDLAGNRVYFPQQFVVGRGRPNTAIDFLTPDPESGTAFDLQPITANPGQLIQLPAAPEGSRERITVPVAVVVRDANGGVGYRVAITSMELSPIYVDEAVGKPVYRLPRGVVSGPVVSKQRVIAELRIVPTSPPIRPLAGAWEFVNEPGGIDPAQRQYRYRFVDPDANYGDPPSPAEISQWPPLFPGQTAPTFGFSNRVQVAGDAGVSAPIPLPYVHPNLGSVHSVLPIDDGQHLWLGVEQRLVKIDSLTGRVVDEVSFVRPDDGGAIFSQQPSVVSNLQRIAAATLAPAVEFFGSPPADLSGQWMVALIEFSDAASSSMIVIDTVDGAVLGTLPYEGTALMSAFRSSDVLWPVFHPQLGSWFTVTSDVRFIREYSLDHGELSRETLAVGAYQLRSEPLTRRLAWDPVGGSMVVLDRYLNLAFDVDSDSLVAAEINPSVGIDLGDETITNVVISDQRELLYSTDGGIVAKLSIDEQATTPAPQITEIVSVAQVGDATDWNLPSANPGQLIKVRGQNLHGGVKLRFPVRDVSYGKLRTDRTYLVRPLRTSSDGTEAWYKVPLQAFSGSIKIDGDDQASGLSLQVVPLIGDKVLGIGIDDFQLHIDGQPVNPCLDGSSSSDCGTRLSNEVLPVARESKQYVTVGGRAAGAVSEASVLDGDAWQLDELVSATPTYGAGFSFEFDSENMAAAGSNLEFTLTSKPGAADEPLPDVLGVQFVSEWPDGVRRYQHRNAVQIDDSSRYGVSLPVDFPGGQFIIQGADDDGIDLQVAATVIAASGDSARGGSAILVAGVNLKDATFSIDELPVIVTDLSQWDETALDLLRLEVPEGVTEGVLRVETDLSTATLDRLKPWWIGSDVPTAEFGTPTFADLPSVNFDRPFSFHADASVDDVCFQVFDDRMQVRNEHTIQVESLGEHQIRLDVNPWEHGNPRRIGSTLIFREYASTIWNIVAVVPNSGELIELSTDDDSDDIDIVGFAFDEPRTMDQVSVQWGDQTWNVDFDRRYAVSSYRREGGYQVWPQYFENSSDSPHATPTNVSGIDDETRDKLDIVFTQRVFDFLPQGPLRFQSPWGYSETAAADADDQILLDHFANELRADRGTPTDLNSPSVRPGQRIELPEPIAERLTAVYFLSSAVDAAGQRVDQWVGAVVSSDASFTVPLGASGSQIRMGLFGENLPIQVVPEIEVSFSYQYPSFDGITFAFHGGDDQSSLQISNKLISLTPAEVSNQSVLVSLLDPRFARVTREDLDAGLRLVSRGGVSEPAFPRMISRIVPATPSVLPPLQDPYVPSVAPDQVVRVEGHQLGNFHSVSLGGMATQLFDISPDGRIAKLRIPRYFNDGDGNGIRTLRYQNADYWALEEIPVNVIIQPNTNLVPVDMVAYQGEPADPGLPSANAGQRISFEVTPGRTSDYRVEVPVWNTETETVERVSLNTFATVGLPHVRATTLYYGTGNRIPISGVIQLKDFDASFEYQLVPQIWDSNLAPNDPLIRTAVLRGAHAWNTEIWWDDQLIYSPDPGADLSDQISASWSAPDTVSITFDPLVYGLPPSGTLVIRTDGGSDRARF
jgi:hypothetical protein